MAANGINKVILIGNLGADPEIWQTQNNMTISTLNIATSESWVDKQTGDRRENTEWHRCIAFRRTAEVARDYLTKGSKVYIEGKLQTRKWQDQSGQTRYTTEIVISDLQMLDTKSGSNSSRQYTNKQNADISSEPKSGVKFDPNALDDYDEPPF